MRYSRPLLWLVCLVSLVALGRFASGQTADLSDSSHVLETLPDAPQAMSHAPESSAASGVLNVSATSLIPDVQDPQATPQSGRAGGTLQKPIHQNPVPSGQPQQTKRILGIIPNFRSVSTDEKLPPMSVKEKFLTATDDSFDYSSIYIPGALAGLGMARNSIPEFGQGVVGYGRYFWHSALDQTSENYMVEFVFPVITRQDPRYYTLGRGGFFKRTGYALSRAAITRNDAGNETFNTSEVVGAGVSSGLSNLYYPSRERTLGNTGSEWAVNVGIDAASFVVKEFWPDINHWLFHQNVPIEGAKQ